MESKPQSQPSSLACPQCKKTVLLSGPARPKSFPFCSERCRLLDLGAWSDGSYTVEGKPVYPAFEEEDSFD